MKYLRKFDNFILLRNLQIIKNRETHMDKMIEYFRHNEKHSPSLKKCNDNMHYKNIKY